MHVISINYKRTTAAQREQYSFRMEETIEFLDGLKRAGVEEVVYLNTCNRVELYINGDYEKAKSLFLAYSGASSEAFEEYARVFEGNDAISHLFYVSAGLKSMVLGEDEILGQMKRAYSLSRENGYTGYYFNSIFQAAFHTAKKIKTETRLSKTSVSVATIVALQCHKFKEDRKNILVIGASSEIGRTLVKNLLSYGDMEIFATRRHTGYAEDGVNVVEYDERYSFVDNADIVVSCTKNPRYTISAGESAMKELSDKPRLFVDLAVPRDIDRDVLNIKGASLVTIDAIEEFARENNEIKAADAKKAEKIIADEMDELSKTLCFHEFIPEFKKMRESISNDFEKFLFQYRNLATAEEFKSFLNIIRQMED